MEKIAEKSVGQIVAEDYRAAQVFENHKIDFCCHGGRNIKEVVQEKNLDLKALTAEIIKATEGGQEGQKDFDAWPLDKLADYIVETHHRYAEEKIAALRPYLEKIAQVHGTNHPELFQIKDIFMEVSGDIARHQKKEEIMLFPFIKKMVNSDESLKKLPAKSIEDRVSMLAEEHDAQGEAFRKMAELSDDFQLPDDACNTYSVTFKLLKDFQKNLHQHIHLENNILFPKALKIIKQL